jgi:hypothetical protein
MKKTLLLLTALASLTIAKGGAPPPGYEGTIPVDTPAPMTIAKAETYSTDGPLTCWTDGPLSLWEVGPYDLKWSGNRDIVDAFDGFHVAQWRYLFTQYPVDAGIEYSATACLNKVMRDLSVNNWHTVYININLHHMDTVYLLTDETYYPFSVLCKSSHLGPMYKNPSRYDSDGNYLGPAI